MVKDWFDRPPRPQTDYTERLRQEREALEAAAMAAEPAALDMRDELREAFAKEYAEDRAAYHFECRRWGDFLSLFINRRTWSYVSGDQWAAKVKAFSTAVNLAATKAIRLELGHVPDEGGALHYSASNYVGEGGKVRAVLPSKEPRRGMFAIEEPPSPRSDGVRVVQYHNDGQWIAHQTADYPREAKDDHIHFDGIRATLFVPAGMGMGVHAAIMAEIERAAPLSKLPDRLG